MHSAENCLERSSDDTPVLGEPTETAAASGATSAREKSGEKCILRDVLCMEVQVEWMCE